jgi:hypothetical protein
MAPSTGAALAATILRDLVDERGDARVLRVPREVADAAAAVDLSPFDPARFRSLLGQRPMLGAAIRHFGKGKGKALKAQSTRITTRDGRVFVEERAEAGAGGRTVTRVGEADQAVLAYLGQKKKDG